MQTQLKLRDMWLKDVQESNRKYNVLQVIHNAFYCVNSNKTYNVLQMIRDKAQNAPRDLQGILLCRKKTHIIGKLQ